VGELSESDCWAAPIVFVPRTLRRTWGTRPDFHWVGCVLWSDRSGSVVSHISRKTSEMWGTRGFVVTPEFDTQGLWLIENYGFRVLGLRRLVPGFE
jgi:hypothetical protein